MARNVHFRQAVQPLLHTQSAADVLHQQNLAAVGGRGGGRGCGSQGVADPTFSFLTMCTGAYSSYSGWLVTLSTLPFHTCDLADLTCC